MRGVLANLIRTAETTDRAAQGQSVSRKTVAEVPLAGLSFGRIVENAAEAVLKDGIGGGVRPAAAAGSHPCETPAMNGVQLPMIALPVLLFVAMVVAAEVGRRLGRLRWLRSDDADTVGTSAVDTAVLGLLGLLIAFWFSSAGTRLDMRRSLIVEEANAIGTAWLRLSILPEDTRLSVRDLFRGYLDTRLAQRPAASPAESQSELCDRLKDQRDAIWRQSVVAVPRCASDQTAAILLASLNEMFDAGTRHQAASMAHTPTEILVLLLFVSIFAALLAGHDMAGTKRFNWLHMAVFAAVTSVTIWVTYDLEMPRYGLIRLDDYDQTMLDVRADFDRPE